MSSEKKEILKEICPNQAIPAKQVRSVDDKLVAQEKIQQCLTELQESLQKTKDAFGSYKTKTFFFPKPEFNKSFKESLQQVEGAVNDMGNLLTSLMGNNKKASGKEKKSKSEKDRRSGEKKLAVKCDQSQSTVNNDKDNSEVLAKVNLNFTPPASDAGNDDEPTAAPLLQPQPQPDNHNVTKVSSSKKRCKSDEDLSEDQVKRPRRSLMNDYANKEITLDEVDSNESVEECKEEVEYEVESIISYKKDKGSYLYKVSWKGYGLKDCTWEPSQHLTDCSEVLLDFYKRLLLEREQTVTNSDMKTLPVDNELKHYLREAFLTYMIPDSEADKTRILKQSWNLKPALTKEEIDALIDKALTARKVERYNIVKKNLIENVSLRSMKLERSKQLAMLRTWERNINSVCTDPAKIVVENEVDLELPPLDFIYINELKEGEGVTVPNDPVLGCACTDCFSSQTSCCASQMNSWFAYNRFGKLKVSLGTPIYECNKRCPCPLTCNNRVVQKGRTYSLSIFRTENMRGWGVKTNEPIKKDSFVVEYVGEVITSEEAELRGHQYDKKGCTYLFDLDFNKGDQNPYTVDATRHGNISHFINHSCDPNLVVFNVWVNCLDPDLPRLALFASRDIRKGEELTFDYNSGLETEQIKLEGTDVMAEELGDDHENYTPEKPTGILSTLSSGIMLKTPKGNRGLKYGKTECRCGAANCRKYFF